MHLMISSFSTVLIPLASANISLRREMEKNTNLAMNRLEEKVNTLMQRTIDVALAWVSKVLTGQKKTDFRPRDDEGGAWLEILQTPVR